MTVLMPVHNAGLYLAQAIDSILNQTHSEFEFLIIDDGSTDSSPAILARYAAADPRIRLHRTHNQGVTRTLNLGLELASHPLIARMDADDIALPERLARQLAYLDAHPSCLALGTAALAIDPEGDPLAYFRYPEDTHAIRDLLLTPPGRSLVHPSVIFRADPVRAAGGYHLDADFVEDYDLWLRLLEHGALACLPDVLLHYRIHPSSVSNQRSDAQRQAHARVLAAARTRLSLPNPPPSNAAEGDPKNRRVSVPPDPSDPSPPSTQPALRPHPPSQVHYSPFTISHPHPPSPDNLKSQISDLKYGDPSPITSTMSPKKPRRRATGEATFFAHLALQGGFPKTARKHARRALLAAPHDSAARWLFLESHLGPRLTTHLKSTYQRLRKRPPSP